MAVADNEEEEEDRENGDDNVATSVAPPDGADMLGNDDDVAHSGHAITITATDGASEE